MKKHIKRTLIALAALLLLWILYSLVSHQCLPPKETEYTLTVMTYNTHGMMIGEQINDKKKMLEYINQQDADIVCLQEVSVYKNPAYLTLPALRKAMKRYPYTYYDFKVYNSKRQFGNVVFSRYPLINKQTIRYESQSNISSQCDVVVNRDTLRLIVNHLQSYGLNREDLLLDTLSMDGLKNSTFSQKLRTADRLRYQQAKQVKQAIREVPYPVIVVGDFNAIPLSRVYWRIKLGLRDTFIEGTFGQLGNTYKRKGIGVRIDYILCSRSLRAIDSKVDKQAKYSDHYPLVSTMGW